MSSYNYPSITKSERKDALVPDPQEYELSEPDRTKITPLPFSAAERLELFDRLTIRNGSRV